jgi:RimJ/RimL family protein N-acetyltransferase
VNRKTAEVGYWPGEHFRGRGIMTVAVRVTTEYLLQERVINRVYGEPFDDSILHPEV